MTKKALNLFLALPIVLFFLGFIDLDANARAPTGMADSIWPTYMHDNQHTGRSQFPGFTQDPVLLWSQYLAHESAWGYGGFVFNEAGDLFLTIGGALMKYDPIARNYLWLAEEFGYSSSLPTVTKSGSLLWTYNNAFGSFDSDGKMSWGWYPLGYNAHAAGSAVIDGDGNMYLIHDAMYSFTSEGDMRWSIPQSDYNSTTPAIGEDGTIYSTQAVNISGSTRYFLVAMNNLGEVQWAYPTDRPMTPAIGPDGTIYIQDDYSRLHAVAPDGNGLWVFDSTELENSSPGTLSPAIGTDGSIYYATRDDIFALSPDGSLKLQIPFNIMGPPQALTLDVNGQVQVCGMEDYRNLCMGFNGNDGSPVWRFYPPIVLDNRTWPMSPPVYAAPGLAYLVWNYNWSWSPPEGDYYVAAIADPSQYPVLYTNESRIDEAVAINSPVFQRSVDVESTVESINWTASISPTTTTWLSVITPNGPTPASIEIAIDPTGLQVGRYSAILLLDTAGRVGRILEIPMELTVSPQNLLYLPFLTNGAGNFELLMNYNNLGVSDQAGRIRQVASFGYDDSYAWSPDGEWIAFNSITRGRDLYLIHPDGTGLFRLVGSHDYEIKPVWSTDGSQIAYLRNAYGHTDMYDVCVVNADGTNNHCLTNDVPYQSNPLWSPNGDWIAYNRHGPFNYSGPEELWIARPDGSQSYRIADIPGVDESLIGWWPDGSKILFKAVHLYTIRPDGSQLTLVAPSLSNYTHYALSPNGKMISFVGYISGDTKLLVINSDGSNLRLLDEGFALSSYTLTWSPDSQRIAYVVNSATGSDVRIVNAYSGKIISAVPGSGTKSHPVWRPRQ